MRSTLQSASPPPPSPSPPSYLPAIIITTAVILLILAVSGTLHFLLRCLSRRRRSIPITPVTHSPTRPDQPSPKSKHQVSSLPLFSLAAALPPTAADCAVCLSAFKQHDQLRLLPACRHAFHAECIDTWLRSTSSCPLCRAPVVLPLISAPVEVEAGSGSFRIEIGSISRRGGDADPAPADPAGIRRTYSIGSSFEYVVEEDVEAFLDRVLHRSPEKQPPPPPAAAAEVTATGELAEAVGGGSRGWLREYVDRLSSSSFRRSARSSRRSDGGGGGGGGEWGFEAEEGGVFSNFSRWLWGPQSMGMR